MKCIRSTQENKILRMRDEAAAKLVASGDWIYIAKKEWKEKVRDSKVN